jgi:hypothetical protein
MFIMKQLLMNKTAGNSHFDIAEFSGITVSHHVFVAEN